MHKSWPLVVVFFLFLLSSTYAVGIAPATMTITLQPGVQQSLTYYAVNNGAKEIEVEAYAETTLFQNIIVFESPKFKVPPNTLKPFTLKFITPKNLPKGEYDVGVGVRESLGTASEGLNTRVAAQSMLHIFNPNGTLKLKMSLTTVNLSAAGQPAYFYIKIENPTDAVLGPITGDLAIIDNGMNEIYRTPLQTIGSIQSKNTSRVTGTWDKTKIGRYTAVATINYAGQTDSASTGIQIGRPSVEVLKINITQQNNFAIITTDVKNTWTEPMQVSAEVTSNYKGKFVASGKSDSVKLLPDTSTALRTELDIKEWRAEELDFDVIVVFDGHTMQQAVTADGYFPEQYQGPPMGAAVGTKFSLPIKATYIIAILLIVIIIILYSMNREEGRKFGS